MPVPLPCLCLDGSVRDRLRGGIWMEEHWLAELQIDADPAEGFPVLAESLLDLTGLSWSDLRALALNLGPGSVLGIRASAVTLQAWSVLRNLPVYGWPGHRVAAWSAIGTCVGVVTEGRAGKWTLQRLGEEGPRGDLEETTPDALANLRLRPIDGGFRNGLPSGLGEPVDAWPTLPAILSARGLATRTEHPDALNSPAAYALWSGIRHGAKSS